MSERIPRPDGNVIKINGYDYELAVQITYGQMVDGETRSLVLQNECIADLEIWNSIDRMFSMGSIIYDDLDGDVGNLVGVFDAYCTIGFHRVRNEQNGATVGGEADPRFQINQGFVVDGVHVVQRVGGMVQYNIKLSGAERLNLFRCASFNNYGDDEQDVITIARSILQNVGLSTDNSFDSTQSSVQIQYITSPNDTAASAIRYLMQKQFFYPDKKDSDIKFLFYDISLGAYRVCQPSSAPMGDMHQMLLTTGNMDIDLLTGRRKVNLASPGSISKAQISRIITKLTRFSYSLDTNEFSKVEQTRAQILGYLCMKDSYARMQTQSPIFHDSIERTTSDWNNTLDIYQECLGVFMNYDSLIVNSRGQLDIPLMSAVDLQVDSSIYAQECEDTKYAQRVAQRYSQLVGSWFVTAVHYIVKPSIQSFTQNLQLSRINRNIVQGS